MSDVKIQRETDGERTLPVFAELDRRMEAVRQRAFDLFASRGGSLGRDLDDWITAEREVLGSSPSALMEHPDEFEVDVALPGFKADDVEVTATPRELVLHAARKSQRRGETEQVVWSEFGSNEVYRRFTLPGDVTPDGVTAELKNGVLRVHVPKGKASNGDTVNVAR
jgi:HSP20 family protein